MGSRSRSAAQLLLSSRNGRGCGHFPAAVVPLPVNNFATEGVQMKSGKIIPSLQRIATLWKQRIISLVEQASWRDVVFASLGLALAFRLRWLLRGVQTGDYVYFFDNWYTQIMADGIKSIGERISNYPPMYLYILYLVSVLFRTVYLTAIKIPSVICDFISAWFMYRIVRLKFGRRPAGVLSALILLFTPTVFLNSAAWGQIESIYTAPLLACIYYLLRKKSWAACIAFGISVSIKLQAIYLVPFLLILWIRKEVSFKHLGAIPAVYLISLLPAWIAGRPFSELLTIYTSQVSGYEGLVHNATSFYT